MRAPWNALTQVLTAPMGALDPDGGEVGEAWAETAARLDLVRLGWFDGCGDARLALSYPCERALRRTLDPDWVRSFGLGLRGQEPARTLPRMTHLGPAAVEPPSEALRTAPSVVSEEEGGANLRAAVAQGDGLLVAAAPREVLPGRAALTELASLAAALGRRLELERRLAYGERVARSARRVAAAGHDLRNELTRALLLQRRHAGGQPVRGADDLTTALRTARDLAGEALRVTVDARDARQALPLVLTAVQPLVIEEVRAAAESARVPAGRMPRLRVRCPEDLRASVDPRAFRRLVRNVVTNALEAAARQHSAGSTSTGEVHVEVAATSVDRHGYGAQLSVRDDGDGLEALALGRFLEPDIEAARHDLSTGLGTASLRNALEECAAPIRVDSAPRRGTSIRVALLDAPPD